MSKIKALLVAVLLIGCFAAAPSETKADFNVLTHPTIIQTQGGNIIIGNLVEWKVGDTSAYKLSAGFLNGSMTKEVTRDIGEAIWVDSVLDLMIAKQKVETLIRKSDGKVLKILVDGKEQAIPKDDDIEIIEQRYEKIEVPAGIFPCLYIKANSGDTKGIEIWISETPTTMENMVKTTMPSQLGKITLELKSFHKVN